MTQTAAYYFIAIYFFVYSRQYWGDVGGSMLVTYFTVRN